MGRHAAYQPTLVERIDASITTSFEKRNLQRPRLPRPSKVAVRHAWAFFFASALALVSVVDPYSGDIETALADYSVYYTADEATTYDVYSGYQLDFSRGGGFEILSGSKAAALFVQEAAVPGAGTAQAFARDYISQFGWGQQQFSCLVALWNRESNWRVNAENKSSGAYGIPQALPGDKMASEGSDWRFNPETQIRWGAKYIYSRYVNPCRALLHSNQTGWY